MMSPGTQIFDQKAHSYEMGLKMLFLTHIALRVSLKILFCESQENLLEFT